MKTAALMLTLLLVVGAGVPAAAHILEVTTSVAMPSPADEEDLDEALRVATQGVLEHVGSLQPVIVAVTAAYVRMGRLYVRFLIADAAGAQQLGGWDTDGERPEGEMSPTGPFI
jgi:hypothetical protein